MPDPTTHESSALFSLKELMVIEEDRLRNEDAVRARREQEEHVLRQREIDAARAREEDARRDAEQRRAESERRRREEDVRLEAIKTAEVVKQRTEAERRVALEAEAQRQEHERAMARIAEDRATKGLRRALGVSIASFVLLVASGAAVWTLSIRPAMERRAEAARAEGADATEAAMKARRDAEALKKQVDELVKQNRDVAAAQSDPQPQTTASAHVVIRRPPGDVSKPPNTMLPPGAVTCDPKSGDPLCGFGAH